jgi:hypothetical protein
MYPAVGLKLEQKRVIPLHSKFTKACEVRKPKDLHAYSDWFLGSASAQHSELSQHH